MVGRRKKFSATTGFGIGSLSRAMPPFDSEYGVPTIHRNHGRAPPWPHPECLPCPTDITRDRLVRQDKDRYTCRTTSKKRLRSSASKARRHASVPPRNGCGAAPFIRALEGNLLRGTSRRSRISEGPAGVPPDQQHDVADREAQLPQSGSVPTEPAATRRQGHVGFKRCYRIRARSQGGGTMTNPWWLVVGAFAGLFVGQEPV